MRIEGPILLAFFLASHPSWLEGGAAPVAGELLDLATGRSCPLLRTRVGGEVAGVVSRVEVTQVFHNPFEEPIEAVYVFPLPHGAAVYDMEIRTGGRRIRGVIEEREKARALYERAKTAGHLAALLEEERPNLFTQSVANVVPGEEVEVTIRYFDELHYGSGSFELVFPMVVGPRYLSSVEDRERLDPPAVPPEMRAGHDVELALTLRSASRLAGVSSPTHAIDIEDAGGDRLTVRLRPEDSIPNKDFVLRYHLEGSEVEALFVPHKPENVDGYFSLLVQPPADSSEVVIPKEMIFVVDSSGSMDGMPIAIVKDAMRYALEGLDPGDSFQIFRFSDSVHAFAPRPVPATAENVLAGLAYVEGLDGRGGTILLEGVRAALSEPEDREKLRIVAFMTDGYIGNEEEIFRYLEAHRGRARLFSFGVGSSVNRHLLDGMADVGRGRASYLLPGESPEVSVRRFYDRLRRPALVDLEIDWGGLDVVDVFPTPLPDLFLDEPLVVYGRYLGPGEGVVTLRGRRGAVPFEKPIALTLPGDAPEGGAMAKLWARAKISALSREEWLRPESSLEDAITRLAIDHRLVSAYTAFVAIEERFLGEGAKRRMEVPVETPFGVSWEGVSGGGMSFSLVEVWHHMGFTARAVDFVLFLMGLASVSVVLERLSAFRSVRPVESVREAGTLAEGEGSGRCARRRKMARAARGIEHDLGRGLRSLLTLGLTTPLVGFLGTVVGVLNAFRGMSLTGSGGIGAVSAGLADALLPFSTALLIGLPSIWAHAYFRARIERAAVEMEKAVLEIEPPG